MKLLFVFYCILATLTLSAQNQGEETLSLNGEWKFKTDPYGNGETRHWYSPELNDESWDRMNVPGNWDLRNEYAHYVGKAWYRKTIAVPDAAKGKLMRLLFEAVNHDSKVWVNGKLLGTNNTGYQPFEFDVSSVVQYGANNTIVVLADNTFRVGALWSWGGIRRPVKLISSATTYISNQFITPSVDVQKHTAALTIKVVCRNTGEQAESVKGEVLISNAAGFKKSIPFSAAIPSLASQEVVVKVLLKKEEVHFWNCDDPFLYQSRVTLSDGAKIIHQVNDHFGLRHVEVDNKNYTLKLNGAVIRPMGFNLIPDDRTTGNTLPLWRIKEDIDLIKSLGGNMARLTHLPLPKEMFDYLDEKGILVFSEIPLWGLDQLVDAASPVPKAWLKRLITNNYNHPAIIGWSVGNEIGDSPGVMEYVADAIQYVRSNDTTRLAVMISHTAYRQKDPIQFSDLGFINRYGTGIGMMADRIHAIHPEKVLFYSEYGYNQLREDLDANVDAKGMMDSIRFKPYLIGGSLWTFNDYRSNYVGTKEFSENRPWGIVDVFRQKKEAWYSFQKQYAPVRNLQVELTQGGSSASIIITPRSVLDLPAYPVSDYSLVWEACGADNKIVQGGFSTLPVIMPGDKALRRSVSWTESSEIAHVDIKLISPLNYTVYDTVIFFKKPQQPEIIFTHAGRTAQNDTSTNSGLIRIVFNKKEPHAYYKARYGTNDLSAETALTLNSYIDIPHLSFGATYQVAVVGVNGAGESEPAAVVKIKVESGLAPPLIYYTEPADKGFFAGYTTAADDYRFIIQYTKKRGAYDTAATLQTGAKGVLFVPGLMNGEQYFFRMKKIKDNNYQTGWSEERVVIPDGNQLPAPPEVHGILRSGSEAMICFEPVKKSTGYVIQYRNTSSDEWVTYRVNAARINEVKITGLTTNKKYAFRMAAVNENGQSEFTSAVSSQPSAVSFQKKRFNDIGFLKADG